jgi:hypothetical protein
MAQGLERSPGAAGDGAGVWFINIRAFPPDSPTFEIIGAHLKSMMSKRARNM